MSLRQKVLRGTAWTTGASITKASVQIIRLSILTRLLERADFGLVAIVTVVLGFTQLFTDMGVSVALFSRNDLTVRQRSGLYWMSILLALGVYVVLLAITPVVSKFYGMTELMTLLPLMGLDLLISSSSRQFRVYKQKDLQFKQVALIDIITTVISLAVAWILASRGWGVYSLVLSTLFASLTSSLLIIVTTIRRYPLQFCLSIKENINVYKVGAYQLGSQILDYFSNQIDVLLIGKIMSVSDLGVYNLIKQLANRVYMLLSSTITTVATPVLAKVKENPNLFKGGFLTFLNIVSFISICVFGCIFVSSEMVLDILYGTDYVSYSRILQIIAAFMGIALFVSGASRLIIISGKTDVGFKWTIIRFAVNPVFIYFGSNYGLTGIVLAQLIYMLIFFSMYYYMVVTKVFSEISLYLYAKPLVRNILIAVSVIATFKLIEIFFANTVPYLFSSLSTILFLFIIMIANRKIILQIIRARN